MFNRYYYIETNTRLIIKKNIDLLRIGLIIDIVKHLSSIDDILFGIRIIIDYRHSSLSIETLLIKLFSFAQYIYAVT